MSTPSVITSIRTALVDTFSVLLDSNNGSLKNIICHTFRSGSDLSDIIKSHRTSTPVGVIAPCLTGTPVGDTPNSRIQRTDISYRCIFAMVHSGYSNEEKAYAELELMHDQVLHLISDVRNNSDEPIPGNKVFPWRFSQCDSYYDSASKVAAITYDFQVRVISTRRSVSG